MITTTVQQLAITIPEGATPGSLLSIPVKGIDNVQFRVPEGYVPGSTLTLCKEEGEWVEAHEASHAEESACASSPCAIADQAAPGPDAGLEPKVESFTVRMNTLAGGLDIIVRPDWSPHGARRFLEMAALGDLDGLSFYRAIPGCIAQFGLPARRAWPPILDDPLVGVPFLLGAVCFTAQEPNSRSSTLFICTGDMRQSMGNQPWETPIGAVAENSLETLDHIETMYGEVTEHGGYGPEVRRIEQEGDTYLRMHFPLLTYIKAARPLDWQMSCRNGAMQETQRSHAQEPTSCSATQVHTHVQFASDSQAYGAVHEEDLQQRSSPQKIAVEVITHQTMEHEQACALPPQEVPVHVVTSPRQPRQSDVAVEVPVEISTLSSTSRKSVPVACESPVEVPVEVKSIPTSRSCALEVPVEVPVEVAQRRPSLSQIPSQQACGSYCVHSPQSTTNGSYQYSYPSAIPQGLSVVASSSCTTAAPPVHTMPSSQAVQSVTTLGPHSFDPSLYQAGSYAVPPADQSLYQTGSYTVPPAHGSYPFTPSIAGQLPPSSPAAGNFNAMMPYMGMCNTGAASMPQQFHQQPPPPPPPQPLGLNMPSLQNPTLRIPQLTAPMLGPVPALKAPSLDGLSGMQSPPAGGMMPWAM